MGWVVTVTSASFLSGLLPVRRVPEPDLPLGSRPLPRPRCGWRQTHSIGGRGWKGRMGGGSVLGDALGRFVISKISDG